MVAILLIGSDYQLVSPSRLEQLSARTEPIQAGLIDLKAAGLIRGAVVLTTCNRFEVLLDLEAAPPTDLARRVLGCDATLQLRELTDAEAVDHVLGVATGLHSMVFGEEQILGQMRRGFQTAEEFGLLSRRLHMLRTRLLGTAREVRHRIGLDHKPRSVAAMAVEQLIGAGSRLCVVGAGETGRLLLEVMQRRHLPPPLVVNRTLTKAEALAKHFGGSAMALHDFVQQRPALDGVVFAVRSARTLLSRQAAEGLRVAVDISQPSVLAADVADAPGLRVCKLDDLAAIADRERQHHAAIKAMGLAEVRALAAQLWSEIGVGRPNLGRVVDLHVEGALAELEQALAGRLSHLPAGDRETVREVLLRAARRNAHYHIKDLRQLATTP